MRFLIPVLFVGFTACLDAQETSAPVPQEDASQDVSDASPVGQEFKSTCFDFLDNDGDGLIDAEDPNCYGFCNAYDPQSCDDGIWETWDLCLSMSWTCMNEYLDDRSENGEEGGGEGEETDPPKPIICSSPCDVPSEQRCDVGDVWECQRQDEDCLEWKLVITCDLGCFDKVEEDGHRPACNECVYDEDCETLDPWCYECEVSDFAEHGSCMNGGIPQCRSGRCEYSAIGGCLHGQCEDATDDHPAQCPFLQEEPECIPAFPEVPGLEMCGLELDNDCDGEIDEGCDVCDSRDDCLKMQSEGEECFVREDGSEYIITLSEVGSCFGGLCASVGHRFECPLGCSSKEQLEGCRATVDWDYDGFTLAEGDCMPHDPFVHAGEDSVLTCSVCPRGGGAPCHCAGGNICRGGVQYAMSYTCSCEDALPGTDVRYCGTSSRVDEVCQNDCSDDGVTCEP